MAWIIWITVISVVITFLFLIQHWLSPEKKIKKPLPPGPTGLPIIGHFHLLGKNLHQDLHRLARKHGPIMYMRFGSVPTVIASSPAAAELFLKTHGLVFANRPYHEAANYFCYEQRDIVFGKYGPYWRELRRLVTLELLSSLKISQFQPMRRAEHRLLVDSLKRASEERETVDMSSRIATVSADMTCLMVFGRKFTDRELDEKGFKEVMRETMEEAAAFVRI